MPDNNALILQLILNSGLAQYPDTTLYKAASMLRPEERPTVPVRLYDDPEPIYRQIYQQLGQAVAEGSHVGNKNSTAVTTPDGKTIYVNRNSSTYKDARKLAATLAHEQVHVANGEDEIPAYRKGLEVLRRFGSKIPKDYVDQYARILLDRELLSKK
jgi:Zn-dependent protease with chaperone function